MRRLLAAALALLAGFPGRAGPPREVGTPYLHDFPPREAGGSHPQNWAITQDARGFIYLGNGFGVLEYDGVRWRLLETGGRTPVRALAWGPDRRLYVGGQGEIGTMEPDAAGAHFVSLTERAGGAPFSFVRSVHVLPEGVFFQTRECLLRYQGGEVTRLDPPGGIWRAFAADGRLYVQGMGGELLQWEAGGLVPVPWGQALRKARITFMLPQKGSGLLVGTMEHGLFRHDGRGLAPFPTEVDALLRTCQVYSGLALSDGTFALTTVTAGVVILDPAGKVALRLDRASGLRDNTVYQCFQDRQWGLWLGLNNGSARAEWPSPVTRFDERSGLMSFPWSLARHEGTLYAATGQGIFFLDAAGPVPRFRAVEGVKGQCLGIVSAGPSLLAVSNQKGVLEIRGGRARQVAAVAFPACVLPSKADPSRVFVGGPEGVTALRRRGSAWRVEGLVPGLGEDIFALVETEPGTLWASTRSFALLRAQFPPGGGPPAVTRFGAGQGLPAENFLFASDLGGRLIVGTSAGIHELDPGGARFVPAAAFMGLFPEGPRTVEFLRPGPGGRVWMQTTDPVTKLREMGAAVPDGRGGYRWEAAPFRRMSGSELAEIRPDPDGVVWFGGPDGLVRYDPSLVGAPRGPQQVRLRQVQARDGRMIYGGAPAPGGEPRLPFRDRSLRFAFALPSFDLESANRYQVLLEGYDKDWSPWGSIPFREYTNLSEGHYRFRVRARDVYGQVSAEDGLSFRILPPWYRTWWAFLLFAGTGVVALAWALRARTRYLMRRNQELSRRVAAATHQIQVRNREVVSQAGDLKRMNAALSRLNEEKNELFGIATHDLRNPLNTIVLAAELLEEEQDPAQVRVAARRIRGEGLRMSELLGRFLDIAAIEGGTLKPEPEAFPLGLVAGDVAGRYESQARRKGLTLDVEMTTPLEAYADLKFTKGILDNLLSNAIKFTFPGTRVTLRVEEDGDGLVVSVADQGPGFTPEDRAGLFGRFSKLSARPTGGESSSGLGLSIVKHMAEAMGAPLEVQSEPGRGATFRLRLPRRPPGGP